MTAAVEYGDRIAHAEAHHPREVHGLVARQRHGFVARVESGSKKPVHASIIVIEPIRLRHYHEATKDPKNTNIVFA